MAEAARITDDIGHVSTWARIARVVARTAVSLAETVIAAGAVVLVSAVLLSNPIGWCAALFIGGAVVGIANGAFPEYAAWKEEKIQSATEDIGDPEITGKITVVGSSNVLVNSLRAARAVIDSSVCSKHSSPPQRIAQGSDSVFINTYPAARKGDKTECSAKIADGSTNVFFGGEQTTYLAIADDREWWETAAEIALAVLLTRGSIGSRLGCLGVGMLANKAFEAIGGGIRSLVGSPVNPSMGVKLLTGEDDIDFALPGPMPIVWQRRYASCDRRDDGCHGTGWSAPYSAELQVRNAGRSDEELVYTDEIGRPVVLPPIQPGHGYYSNTELFTIARSEGGFYELWTDDGLIHQFGTPRHAHDGDAKLRVMKVRDRNGNWHALQRDAAGRITTLSDNTGRLLRFRYGQAAPLELRVLSIAIEKAAPGETPATLAEYHYDEAGLLRQVVLRGSGVEREFAYRDGLMVYQKDARGLECRYHWEDSRAATGPEGTPRVLHHSSSDGERYDFAYARTADGGHTRVTDQLGREYRWDWNHEYNPVAYTNPLGAQWRIEWRGPAQIRKVIAPDGRFAQIDYSDQGLPVAETDALGRRTTTLWHEGWMAPLKITEPDQGEWRFEYDERGNLVAQTDPAGQEERYVLDAQGLVLQMVDAKGGRKLLAWDARALLQSYTDCSGRTTRYTYDGRGELKSMVDALGQETHLVYNARGHLVSTSLPDGSHYQYRYGPGGVIDSHADPLGRLTHFRHNLRAQPTAVVDAEQRQVLLRYDAALRLSTLVNENGERFTFRYDDDDRLVEEQRVGGTRVTVEYDAIGWPVAVTHHPALGDDAALQTLAGHAAHAAAEPLRTELVRDAVGRLVEKRTAQHHYHYRYDAVDQLLSATKLQVLADGSLKPLHTTAFAYDAAGNLAEETATDAVTGQRHTLRHAHDPLGNRTQTVLPSLPGALSNERALNYLYYGSGHLHQINLSQRNTAVPDAQAVHQLISDIERDALHREVQRSQGRIATRFALDPLGRRQGAWTRSASLVSAPFGAGDAQWQQAILSAGTPAQSPLNGLMKAYAYDKVGELRQSRHSLHGDSGHRYDATGRVEQSIRQAFGHGAAAQPAANSETFRYDPAGNMLDNAAQGALQSRTQHLQAGYVRDNLVRVYEDKRYFYDGHGRLIRKLAGRHTAQTFVWDDESRLVQVTTTRRPGTEHASTQSIRFDYDAIGRRVAKHDSFGSTFFIWEGMRLIEERRGANVISYVYEPQSHVPLARLDARGDATQNGGLGTVDDATPAQAPARTEPADALPAGRPLAANDTDEARYWRALDATASQPVPGTGTHGLGGGARLCDVYYFHTDQIGLPEELSNAQGQLVWRATFKTWGATAEEQWELQQLDGAQARAHDGAGLPGDLEREQNLRFQGQYLDRETGLHYNTFRYYDADTGRFISPDPIGVWGGINLGSYSPNPTGWIDPLGLLNEGETAGYGSPKHRGDGLEAHEVLRNKKVQEAGIGTGRRVKGNPSIALSPKNHDAVHAEENALRRAMGLGVNDMLKTGKAEIRLMSQAIYNSLVVNKKITIQQLRTARRMATSWAKAKGCY